MSGNPAIAQTISKKQWLAVSLEPVGQQGVAAASPTLYVPTKAGIKRTKKFEYQDEDRNSRDGQYDRIPTTQEGEVDPKGSWYNDTFVYFLYALMGGMTTSQPDATHAPTVQKHNLTLADVPPTLTLWKAYHTFLYQMPMQAVTKLQLKWSAEKGFECDVSTKGAFGSKQTGWNFTPTYSSVKPFSGYAPLITLNAGQSSDIDEVTITLEQAVQLFFSSAGSPDVQRIDFGERKAQIEFTARFDSDAIYTEYVNNIEDSFTFDVSGALIVNSGASGTPPNTAYNEELHMNFPRIGFDEGMHDTSKLNTLVKMKATAMEPSGSLDALWTAWVQNTVTSYAS